MYVKHTVVPQIYSDPTSHSAKNALFAPDLVESGVTILTHTKAYSGVFSLAAGVAEDLSLGDLTSVKGMYLEVKDADTAIINLRLNGSTDDIRLLPPDLGSPAVSKAKMFLEAAITQINLNSSVDTTGIFCVWGS